MTIPHGQVIGVDLGEPSYTAITVYNVMDKDPAMVYFKAFMEKRDQELIATLYRYLQEIDFRRTPRLTMAVTITLVRLQLACRDLVKDMGSIPMTKSKDFKRVLSLVTEGHDRPESTATLNVHSA